MDRSVRIVLEISAGIGLYLIFLFIGKYELLGSYSSIVIWNLIYFAGFGYAPLGTNSNGEQMYEGTPMVFFFLLFGLAIGFILYPILIVTLTELMLFLRRRWIKDPG